MSENPPNWNLETLLVHTGEHQAPQDVARQGMPTSLPIYASATFVHDDADALDSAFEPPAPDAPPVFSYSRHGNPTVAGLEQALAAAECGKGAVAFGSGMAALYAALLAAGLAPGETIIAANNLYGASTGMLRKIFAPQGARVILRDLTDTAATCQAIEEEQPTVVLLETISNPLLQVCDLPTIAEAGRKVGAVIVVDSTFTTPILLRPLEQGADIVVHSATKYLGGHGDALGGVAIANTSYHLSAITSNLRMLGGVLSPFEARLISRGLKTLALRMERHCANAASVARWLAQDARVSCVYYPGLPTHPQHELASRLLRNGLYGGMVSFEIRNADRAAVHRFMDALRLCLCGTSLGDVYSLISYSARSSHRDLTPAQRAEQGISDGLVRLSVGIEHPNDIIADLDQALAAIQTEV
ncbi:MAG TPA: aminotransferase class I/II-fold pyridoxal phosphate-dependent enzyme [Ktedonobacterales bacterium]|jgi:cystathionine gamma-synthase/methionine-gamma-lyase